MLATGVPAGPGITAGPQPPRAPARPASDLAAARVVLRGVRLHRPSGTVTHVRLRYHSRVYACRVQAAPAGDHSRLTVELLEAADQAAPGQSAQLLCGDLVVGQGTISPA